MSNKVTIMIPTYNQSQYIEQTIDSALDQDYHNLEIIISDDSTDTKTKKIVKTKYKKYLENNKIKYFYNKPSLGRVKNYRIMLYERAKGDYVLNLDGDDWLIDNTYITKAVKILNNDNDIICVTAKVKVYIDNINKVIERNINKNLDKKMKGCDYLKRIAIDNDFSFSHMTTLYRREKALEINFYDKDIIFSDGESISKLICGNYIYYIDKFIGIWRLHDNNESKKIIKDLDNIENVFILEKYIFEFCKKHSLCKNEINKNWFYLISIKRLYEILKIYIKNLNFISLILFLKRIFFYDKKLFSNFCKFLIKKIFIRVKL